MKFEKNTWVHYPEQSTKEVLLYLVLSLIWTQSFRFKRLMNYSKRDFVSSRTFRTSYFEPVTNKLL